MITDLFFNRYSARPLMMSEGVPADVQRFFTQAAQIFFNEVAPALDLDQKFFQHAHDAFVRELGAGRLGMGPYHEVCFRFLTERYDLWNDAHGTPDIFLKLRLSLTELLFRQAEGIVLASSNVVPRGVTLASRLPGHLAPHNRDTYKKALEELNRRFREASMPLEYHNGFIQFVQDRLTQQQTAAPFWDLLQDPKWANVDMDIKEAIDRCDNHGRDAALYAMKALESTLKIISDEKGWTTGKEKGASNYIDNLVSKAHGNYIADWEAEMLRLIFGKIRNPHGHGPGTAAPPALSQKQTSWVIESCMGWIKSLADR
jgi:AbiJ N-terminal domain 4